MWFMGRRCEKTEGELYVWDVGRRGDTIDVSTSTLWGKDFKQNGIRSYS